MRNDITMKDLLGLTITAIRKETSTHRFDGDVLVFEFAGILKMACMGHYSDCCENVWLEDVVGDLDDLIGNPLLVSAMESFDGSNGSDSYSSTWTYYKMDTIKGGVTLRWCGESNGFYSEEVSLTWEDMEYDYND